MDYSSERNHGCRIFEYTHRGLTFITLENEILKMSIIADKGADIIELLYKPLDVDLMWKAPGGIKEPGKHIPTIASATGSYCDYFAGGWQEILPGGGPDTYRGAELGLHGELTLLPWHYAIEADAADEIAVVFSCRTVRFPFHLKKRIRLTSHSPLIHFEEWLTNESGEAIEFLWAQHPAFGAPFIRGGCRIDIPAAEFATSDFYNSATALFKPEHKGPWPVDIGKNGEKVDLSVVPSGEKPVSDLYYVRGLDEGWYAITNQALQLGFGLCWDVAVFPYVTYWQVCGGSYGYPWYGRTYNIGLEIWNSFTDKIRTARQNGTIQKIQGDETIHTTYKAVIYRGLDRVKRISREGVVA